MDAWLSHRRRWVVGSLVLLAALFRIIYFVQLNDGPCIQQHRWKNSDMHFFDAWAKWIAGGDWLTNDSVHPLVPWQRDISTTAMATHADLKESVAKEAAAKGQKDLDRVLWDRWLEGKTFHQEPLYPYMVAVTYSIFGPDVRWVFAWQMLFGIGSVLLIYLIGRRYFGDLAGTIAGFLAVFYAPIMYYELVLLRDSLMIFFSLALVYFFGLAVDKNKNAYWFAYGVVAGLTLFLKSTFAPLIAACLVVSALTWRTRQPVPWSFGAAAVAGILLMLAPCVARNVYVGVAPFALSSPGMGALTLIENDTADYPEDSGTVFNLKYAPEIMAKTNGKFFASGVEVLNTHPNAWSVVKMVWHKFSFVWHWYEIPNNDNLYYYALHAPILRWLPITFLITAPLALVGLAAGLRNMRENWPLYLLLAISLVPLLISTTLSRYRIPFAATLIPFAGYTLMKLGDWVLRKRFVPLATSLAAIVLLGFWVGRPMAAREPLIRLADYGAPYNYYYRPRVDAAEKAKDWAEMRRVIQNALICEPEFVWSLDAAHPPRSGYELELAKLFEWTHGKLAVSLEGLRDTNEARLHAIRADEIRQSIEKAKPAQ